MNKYLLACIAVFVVTLVSPQVIAQQVFTLNQLEESEIKLAKESPDRKSFYSLNESIFLNPAFTKGAMMDIQKNNGEMERLIIAGKEEYIPGVISIRAFKQGNPASIFSATYNKGTFNGVFYDDFGSPMYFNNDVASSRNYISLNNERVDNHLSCEIDHTKELVSTPHFHNRIEEAKSKSAYTQNSVASPLIAAEDDSITIDLMIVYTNASETWALTSGFGDINGVMAQSVNLSQTALNSSGIGVNLRLVHTYNTNYNEELDGVDSEDRLSRFTQNSARPNFSPEEGYDGFMEEIHDLRNQFGADVVSLFVRIEDTGGLGWILNGSGGSPDLAFNLNRVQQVADTFTLVHEIGHNMGSNHSRTQFDSEADASGGLFQYSVGYQNISSSYHTVMAYSDGLQEAPVFSSPNINYLGTPAGLSSTSVPTDNVRSLKEIKRTISNYRSTMVDPPAASLLADVINIEMNREEDLTLPFQIFNDGESVLVWDIDFNFTTGTFKSAKNEDERMEVASFDRIIRSPYNYSNIEKRNDKSLMAEETLYSTSFEAGEDFTLGSFEGLTEWRALSSEDQFSISSINPNSGSQHMRIVGEGAQSTKFISAPFIGYQQFGAYEITVNFSVSSTEEVYDIYVFDGKTGEFSTAVVINQGIFFGAVLNEQQQVSFSGNANGSITVDTYHELKMVMDPDNEVIRYFLNGVQVYENSYLGGFSPGELIFLNRDDVNGSIFDIDDIEVKQLSAPYDWLSVSNFTGYTVEDASSSRSLQFTTKGVSAGQYNTNMVVTTNDPQNPELVVPITLTVADVVSNEELDTPLTLSLNQNYPNPFNPATTISYTLNSTVEVQLDVFNIQGQRVATLVDGRQQAGEHNVAFNASNLSSGVYMYRLQAGAEILTRQMVLIK